LTMHPPRVVTPGRCQIGYMDHTGYHRLNRVLTFTNNVVQSASPMDRQCTSPNLMASFLRIEVGKNLPTKAIASSQAFYVIRGAGVTSGEHGTITWSEVGALQVELSC
jgi:hypothetical protein